jgi:anti-anti-sigma regulatory factor
MLKVTTQTDNKATKLVVEGRMVGPWVGELDRCWQTVANTNPRELLVDLTGVTYIDHEGKALLMRMWQRGAQFRAVGCLTRCIVDEITKPGRGCSSHSPQKD